MTPRRISTLASLSVLLLLGGCLEVEQHPPWVQGKYNGKTDAMPAQKNFGGNVLRWNATITDRNHLQNEYNRMEPSSRR